MDIEVVNVERLRFDDGAPVRAASAVVPLGDGYLVVPDDTTHGAWCRGRSVTPVRLLPPVDSHEAFSAAAGTKHLKPDLEAACAVTVDGDPAVLVMGSGSSPARMRWVLLRVERGSPQARSADLSPLYTRVADALAVAPDELNLEGVCVVDDALRWFHRGLPSAGQPSRSIDLDLSSAVAAAAGRTDPAAVPVAAPRTYDTTEVGGSPLALTDVVRLPGGALVASAVAEDSPNPRDDGPVLASALVRLGDGGLDEVAALPLMDDEVIKVEGLMVLEADATSPLLLAVADVDDPEAASLAVTLRLRL